MYNKMSVLVILGAHDKKKLERAEGAGITQILFAVYEFELIKSFHFLQDNKACFQDEFI